MPDEIEGPKLLQFADEDLPTRILPRLDADGVLLLKRHGARMKEALCAWRGVDVTLDANEVRSGYWAFWFAGKRKPSAAELTAWLQWSEGSTAPIDLNPPPVLGDE